MKASTRALNGPDLFKDLISVLSPKFVVLGYWGPPSPPPGEDRFHPESRAAALIPLGAAVRIGSTPLSNVIAVTSDPVVPGVETIMTASSFCKSASVTAGKRSEEHTSELQSHLNIVCRLLLEKKNTFPRPYATWILSTPNCS